MIVSGSINKDTAVYKTLYEFYKMRHKKEYDFCVTHAVLTVVGAFLITVILNLFGADCDLRWAFMCHVVCGFTWFFGDRWALHKRFDDHEWEVNAGYVIEETGATHEGIRELHDLGLRFFTVLDMLDGYVGVTCRSADAVKDLDDGVPVWYNLELDALFLRKQDTDEKE